MNNKKVPRKKTSAIYLAIVLVAGTFAAISQSFIIGVNAHGETYDYGMDRKYNSYEQDYEMDNYDKKTYRNSYEQDYPSYKKDDSYGNDRYYDKSNKDNSRSDLLKKLKCNNINANLNNIDANFGSPVEGDTNGANGGADGQALSAQGGEAISANGLMNSASNGDRRFVDRENDFAFVCINNNNNIITTDGGGNPTEPDATLNVIKNVDCIYLIGILDPVQACEMLQERITENQFLIEVTDDNPNPSQFPGSEAGTIVTLGAGNYVVSETPDVASIQSDIDFLENQFKLMTGLEYEITGPFPTFTGDCTDVEPDVTLSTEATGTIEAGESQTCEIENFFDISNVIEE